MGINSDYLDLAVGMAVVFFLLSLVVSGLNEALQWSTRVRAKFLWSYLHDLTDPARNKTLPGGKRGIIGLWRGNDQRPASGLPTDGTTPADDPDLTLRRLAHALDPIDPQQLVVNPAAGNVRKTSIKHVPPGSLAQAFLEVFAEVGRERFDAALAELVDAVALDLDSDPAIARLAEEMGGSDLTTATAVAAALDQLRANLATAADEAAASAHGLALVEQLRSLPGAVGGTDIAEAAAALAGATWSAKNAPAAQKEDSLKRARALTRDLSSAIIRTFPERFPRQRIEGAIERLGPSPLGATTRRLWEAAEGRIDGFREGLEGYFESEMTRLSGLYKRSIRMIVAILAVIVAVTANVDSIGLARDLWRNPDGRASLVAQADALSQEATTPTDTATLERLREQCEEASPEEGAEINSVEDAARAYDAVRTCVNDALSRLNGLDLIDRALWINPASWFDDAVPGLSSTGEAGGDWWLHAIGVALTALALVVGASFWFDLIKRLTGIRKGLVGQT